MSIYTIIAIALPAVILGAWALTWATQALGRAADRRIDRDFDRAGVRRSPYGPVQKYGMQEPLPAYKFPAIAELNRLIDQALADGIEQDERNEAEVEAFRADLDAWGRESA